MKQKSLCELVQFIPGINPSRVDPISLSYYDQAAFKADFQHQDLPPRETPPQSANHPFALKEGDVVISNAIQLATLVRHNNIGKVPSLNFTKVIFTSQDLDKAYFLYLFNFYPEVKRQIERSLQRSLSSIRIPLRSLNQITIPLPHKEKQQQIGLIYLETLKLQNTLHKYGSLLEQLSFTVLADALQGGH